MVAYGWIGPRLPGKPEAGGGEAGKCQPRDQLAKLDWAEPHQATKTTRPRATGVDGVMRSPTFDIYPPDRQLVGTEPYWTGHTNGFVGGVVGTVSYRRTMFPEVHRLVSVNGRHRHARPWSNPGLRRFAGQHQRVEPRFSQHCRRLTQPLPSPRCTMASHRGRRLELALTAAMRRGWLEVPFS